jgi:hypothetical protein
MLQLEILFLPAELQNDDPLLESEYEESLLELDAFLITVGLDSDP